MQQGLAIDLEQTTYYVNHVTLIPTGETAMAGWRTWLFTLLYQNSIPAARYFRIPPDRVFEVGNYVEL
jgi:KUP system potassium uptake protein